MSSLLPVLALAISGFESPGFLPLQLDRVPVSRPAAAGRAFATTGRVVHFAVVPILFADGDSTWSSDTLGKTYSGPSREVSVKAFYDEQSRGAISLDFQVCPWRRTTAKRSDCAVQNTSYGTCLVRLMRDALRSAVASGISPATLDNDGDGTLDGLLVVYNGPAYQSSDSKSDPLCARFSAGSSDTSLAGGLTLVQALFLPETEDGRLAKAGSPAHEIGHILGLPDIYDDDDAEHGQDGGMGTWELMCMGGLGAKFDAGLGVYPRWKPVGLSSFCSSRLGWTAPADIDSEQDVRLAPGRAVRVWTDPYGALQHLLLENRDRSGVDSVLPGPGLLATRVRPVRLPILRYGVPHMVNSDSSDMGLEILEASGQQRIQSNIYPFAASNHLYGSLTDTLTGSGPVPLRNPDGTATDAWVRGIRLDGDDVLLRVHPARRRGYALPQVPDTVGGTSFAIQRLSLLTAVTVPASGRIRAISTVVPSSAGAVTTSIWSARRNPPAAALASTQDTGIAGSIAHARWNWLSSPVAVTRGQVLYIGTDASSPDGGNVYLDAARARTSDSAWFWTSSGGYSTSTYKPAVRILVETDSSSTGLAQESATPSGPRIRRVGSLLRIAGAAPGLALEVRATDLLGRETWRVVRVADASGEAVVDLPGSGGVRILRVRSADAESPALLDLP